MRWISPRAFCFFVSGFSRFHQPLTWWYTESHWQENNFLSSKDTLICRKYVPRWLECSSREFQRCQASREKFFLKSKIVKTSLMSDKNQIDNIWVWFVWASPAVACSVSFMNFLKPRPSFTWWLMFQMFQPISTKYFRKEFRVQPDLFFQTCRSQIPRRWNPIYPLGDNPSNKLSS